MRDVVKQAIEKFSSRELPRDPAFYQERRQQVLQLVETIQLSTERHISWEPPIDLFNFYHLQIPVDRDLEIPLYEITVDLVEGLANENRSTSFFHLLISNFSPFTFIYGVRFLPSDFQESIFAESSFQNSLEEELFEMIQENIEKEGWVFLSSSEANEIVSDIPSPWPHRGENVLVKHILFPGCSALCDG